MNRWRGTENRLELRRKGRRGRFTRVISKSVRGEYKEGP